MEETKNTENFDEVLDENEEVEIEEPAKESKFKKAVSKAKDKIKEVKDWLRLIRLEADTLKMRMERLLRTIMSNSKTFLGILKSLKKLKSNITERHL